MATYKSYADEKVVKIVLEGNTTAFEELVNRYQQPILRYCKRLLNYHTQDAEDVASEVFYKAYKSLASFSTNLKFSSWLYRIAHNTAVNLIRDKSKLFYVDIQDFWHIPQTKKEETKIDKIQLEKALDKLNSTDKSLLILFHLEELSLKEISDIFKLTPNTVAVKLKRARERARKHIKL
ncbi:MAG: sigma-70 family RNA polymerase sigma factor [Patescibacteria group bacterium]